MNVWPPTMVQVSENPQLSGLHNCCIFIETDVIYDTALFFRIVHQGRVKKDTPITYWLLKILRNMNSLSPDYFRFEQVTAQDF